MICKSDVFQTFFFKNMHIIKIMWAIYNQLTFIMVYELVHRVSCTGSEVKFLSCVWLFVTPWTVAYQAPPSLGFSRQEHWSGLPFPSTADLPNSVIEPSLLHCRQMLYHLSHQGRSSVHIYFLICSPGNIFFLIFKMKKTENKASQ